MIKKAKVLGLLRRYKDGDIGSFLQNEYRQTLKTLEYWYQQFIDFAAAVEKDTFNYPCYFEVTDGSGTPALNASRSPDVLEITRQSAGRYLVRFNKAFVGINYVTSYIELASGSPASSILILRSVDTTMRSVVVEFLNGSYTATDVASGSKIGIKFYIDEE